MKQNFIGDRLDTAMPAILHNRMQPEEWNHFVREINLAIKDAQSYMRFSPWLISGLVFVAILVILLDIALSQSIFGNVQVGTLSLCAFVSIGVGIICYMSMCRPTNYCENEVELICEEYCDPERDMFFFYRHHNNMVHVTENRFYIEVFVGEVDQPAPLAIMPEETPEDVAREFPEWTDDAMPPPEPEHLLLMDAPREQLLLEAAPQEQLLLEAAAADSTALAVATSSSRSRSQPSFSADDSQGLVRRDLVWRAGPRNQDNVQQFPSNAPRGGPRNNSRVLPPSGTQYSTELVPVGGVARQEEDEQETNLVPRTRDIV